MQKRVGLGFPIQWDSNAAAKLKTPSQPKFCGMGTPLFQTLSLRQGIPTFSLWLER